MNLPTDLGHVRVVLARYPDAERVDVIDVRSGNGLAALLSFDPADAVQLAHHLFQVAGWVEPPPRRRPVPGDQLRPTNRRGS